MGDSTLRHCVSCKEPMPQARRGSYCRDCRREYNREWAKRNPEKVAAANRRARERRKNDPEYRARKLAQERALREKNREATRAAGRRYAEANREKRYAYDIERRFGLTLEEYRDRLARGCAICGSHERMCMDHCHETGQVREPLCGPCNSTLGFMKDDPTRLRAAAAYLEKHREAPNTSSEGNDD